MAASVKGPAHAVHIKVSVEAKKLINEMFIDHFCSQIL